MQSRVSNDRMSVRCYLTAAVVALLASAAPIKAEAALLTVGFDGLTTSQGGSVFGSFTYDTDTLSSGLYTLTHFEILVYGGINLGGPFQVPQQPVGAAPTGTVTSVPKTDGDVLIGTLDMTYWGSSVLFNAIFAADGTANGSFNAFGRGDPFSGAVNYVPRLPEPVPGPGAMALLAGGLLGLGFAARRRRSDKESDNASNL